MDHRLRNPFPALAVLCLLAAPLAAQWDQCNPGEERAFAPGPYGIGYYDTADDFTLEVLDAAGQPGTGATFVYSDLFPGCENVVFFGYRRNSCYAVYTALSEPGELLAASPRNVHYVFFSFESDPNLILEDIQNIRDSFENDLASMAQAEQDYWRPRLHYVTQSGAALPGWLGNFVQTTFFSAHPYWGWGIDRTQRLRNIGMTQDPNFVIECTPGDPNTQTWFPRTSHLANEPRQWNHEWYRDTQLAAETFTEIPVWQERFSGNIYADVVFPDAAEMATYDTMLLDLELLCYDRDGDTVISNVDCEWDYLIHAYLCDPDDPNDCSTEIGRWITTYGRDGHWVVDVSPMLAFLRDGGQRRLRFYSQNGYDIDFRILLTNRGKGTRPFSATYLYSGGGFNLSYNPNHPPKRVSVPAWAERTELASFITGHGFGDLENCAEFCNHQHFFTIGTSSYLRQHPTAGTPYGCMDQVDQQVDGYSGPGTIANQFGTWVFGRGGWCPGLEVKPWLVDVTSDVQPGQESRISYEALFDGQPYDPQPGGGGGFSARITMSSWLVHHIGPPEVDCANGVDDDGDGDADCADTGCYGDPACFGTDIDGDGVAEPEDCDPFDGGAFAAPVGLDLIQVVRDRAAATTTAVVSWDDLRPTSGSGTVYDIITGSLADLAADGDFTLSTCERGLPTTSYEDTADATGGRYFLGRARNVCGRTSWARNVGGVCE